MAFAFTASAAELRFEARHDHLRGGCKGTLAFEAHGVTYESKKHRFALPYEEIQRLELSPRQVRIRTYEDNKWKLGADREFKFQGAGFESAYGFLSQRLDQRLVANLDAGVSDVLWQAPAKLLRRFGGAHGTLAFARDRIVFSAARDSRTWRYADIDNISTAGPFDFSITTLAGTTRFQLKQPLPERQYDVLWRNLFHRRDAETAQRRNRY